MQHLGIQGKLYPNKDQLAKIKNTIGCCRFVYNYYLSYSMKEYEKGNKTNYYTWAKDLTILKRESDKLWLNEVSSVSLQQSLKDLNKAYGRFFKLKTREAYPKFHKHGEKSTIRFASNNNSVRLTNNHRIVLPTLGKVKYRGFKNLPKNYRILSATISVSSDNSVFISLNIECEDFTPLPKIDSVIGIDLGVKTLVTCSDGTEFPKLEKIFLLNKKKDFYQMKISTAQKGSKNQMKWRRKFTRLSRKISNIHKGYAQFIADKLTRYNQIICMEDLFIPNMLEGKIHNINRAISDSGMGNLTTLIKWFAEKRGRIVQFVDRFYPSSQICHSCGYQNSEVKDLSIRIWTCPNCGKENLRDLNAALNIRDAGLATLRANSARNDLLLVD